jgi:hypothetical protein
MDFRDLSRATNEEKLASHSDKPQSYLGPKTDLVNMLFLESHR